jgi:crotonobetainyl-CoA:carnitine CoA-transferase CaiB-like acyl-CoA transferase
VQESTSTTLSNQNAPLSETQLRKALFAALKEKRTADENLKLADAALAAAYQLSAADEAEKQALREERDTFARISQSKSAEIEQLVKAIDNYQQANRAATARADNAEREVTRQKLTLSRQEFSVRFLVHLPA